MTQKEMIIDHLKKYKRITDREAYAEMGIRRLGARIWDLRALGYNIKTEITTKPNRYGKKTSFATYVLEDEDEVSEL